MKNIILTIALLLFWSIAFSQNTFKIYGGHFVVAGSTDLVLNNTEFENQGNFEAGTGTVTIKGGGTNTQSAIGGLSATTFYNLKIDKSSNGTELNILIQVDNELQMVSGNLDLNNNDLILGNSNSIISGESQSSYITGTSGGEVIISTSLNAPNSENPGNIGATISSFANLGTTTIKRGHLSLDVNGSIAIDRYYDIIPTNNTALDATVRFSYMDHELNGLMEGDLAPYSFNGVDWDEYLTTANDETNNWVETDGIDEFSIFTLAEMVAPLPVELVFFQAKKSGEQQVLLSWQTDTEINNDFFTVERSRDGINFEFLEKINGAGNSSEPLTYQIFDRNPLSGKNFYRLKQTDFDGTFTYSEIRVVEFDKSGKLVSIFPNPTSDELNIQFDKEWKDAEMQLYDHVGKLIISQQLSEIEAQKVLHLGHLSSGVYVFKIFSENEVFSEKIILQKPN